MNILTVLGAAQAFLGFGENCVTVPRICPNNDITFHLYTRETQDSPTQLDMNHPEDVKCANFVPGRPLIFLVHGYTGHKDFAPNNNIRPAYFESGDFNIISVDYGPIAKEPCYIQAVSNLKTVANCSAQLINYLVDEEIFDIDSIHVIGFSLGAQTSGLISNFMAPGRKLRRVSWISNV